MKKQLEEQVIPALVKQLEITEGELALAVPEQWRTSGQHLRS